MLEKTLSPDFDENVRMLDAALHVNDNFDMLKRELTISGTRCVFYYIDGFVNAGMMQKLLLYLVTVKNFGNGTREAAERFAKESCPSVEVDVMDSPDTLVTMVMSGCSLFLSEGFGPSAIVIDARTYPARDPEEPENDRVMRGSRDGFVETLLFNTALIRRRIRDPELTVEYLNVGTSTRTDVVMCYMKSKADRSYTEYIRNKLKELKTSSLTMGHRSLIECLVPHYWWNPFPKVRSTERPDAASASILEGSIVLLCDNSPEALILPTSIFDFLQETDDYYFPPLTGTYLRILRHFVFWLTMLVTPVWYLLLEYQDVLPEWLLVVVPKEPGTIPILAQLLLVELALDGLKLASLNTPSVLSNSLSVVGGLLLGDYAVQTGWLSPDVILYMAFVAIGNFTQSSYELGYAFKYFRVMLLILTAIFRVWGFIAGFVIMTVILCLNRTVNGKRSYLYPLFPFHPKALARLLFRLQKND